MSPKVVELVEVDESLLVQLEDGEEPDEHSSRSTKPWVSCRKVDAPDLRELVDELRDRVGDARPDRRDVVEVDTRHRLRRRGAEERRPQPIGGDAREEVGREVEEALLEPSSARVRPSRLGGEAIEHRGDVLERLALEQAGEQQIALFPEGELLVEVDVVAPGSRRRAFSSTSVAAMSRNSVATSRSSRSRRRMRSSSVR